MDAKLAKGYLGNPKLKAPETKIQWPSEYISEITKCANDPLYFAEKYVKIITLDDGIQPFKPRKYQEEILTKSIDHRKLIVKIGRQSGKTTAIVAMALHYVVFNSEKTVIILAHKGELAREILKRIQFAYELLPKWLQHGILEYNKGSMEFDNNSRIVTGATSSASIRGYTANMVIMDEVAFVDGFEEFFTSVFPTITSGRDSKLVMISTPNGRNHFFDFWEKANLPEDDGWNGFFPIQATWRDVPGRDEVWKKNEIAVLGDIKFQQEHEVSFLGSSATLLSTTALSAFVAERPVSTNEHIKTYVTNIPKGHKYVICLDTSEGKGLDFHAAHVIDVTNKPYTQVATFHNNTYHPIAVSKTIGMLAKKFNDAFILVEQQAIGTKVAEMLYEDGVDNIIRTKRFRLGYKIYYGSGEFGLRQTHKSKIIGCLALKSLVENGNLSIVDRQTINEFSTFIRADKENEAYQASSNSKDDLVMGLVLFGWLTTTDFFDNNGFFDARKSDALDTLAEVEENFKSLVLTSETDEAYTVTSDELHWILSQ